FLNRPVPFLTPRVPLRSRRMLVHERFVDQALRTPDHVAVADERGRRVEYRELRAASARLARRLCALGTRPDDRVAVCMERSVELVASMLGVLEAGGCYVPIEPT